jgi:formylglycine-generating enzyme required for sulfatase activity
MTSAPLGEKTAFGETSMQTMKASVILVLAVVVLAAIGGCKSKGSSGQGKSDAGSASKPGLVGYVGTPTNTFPVPLSDTVPAKQVTLDFGNNVSMKLVLIPAGKFMMGSPENEKDRYDTEGPQHEVTISKAFYIGAYHVMQEQYERIMGNNPSRFKGAQNPVESVSWNDAAEFCKKLSQASGKTVRLPTEAQWEYACRAGSKTRFSYGDDNDYSDLGDYAWYNKNSNGQTHPVGQKKPNVWGLYDMHGNVWQWCSDWYADSYAKANNTNPQGPDSGVVRVLRGGSWISDPRDCRSANRGGGVPVNRVSDVGFRVVVDLK